MLTDILDNLRQFLATHPRAKPALISLLALAACAYLYSSFYIVYVAVDTSREDMELRSLRVEAYASDSATTGVKSAKKILPNFIQILPRSYDYFEATTDEYATIQSSQTHNWWPYRTVRMTLSPQKQLQKLATSGGACPVVSKENKVYTYRCGNPRYLFSQNTSTSPWSIDSQNLLSTYKIVTPFKQGLLGVRNTGTLTVQESFAYIDPDTGDAQRIKSPPQIADDIKHISNITTDSADTSSPYAVLSNHKKQKFYAVNLDTSQIVNEVDYPKDTYTPKSNLDCSMLHKKVACYIGKYTASPENTPSSTPPGDKSSHSEEAEEPKLSAVVLFDADKKSEPTQLRVHSYIKQIALGEEGRVYAIDTWDNLVELTSGGRQPRLIARSVGQMNYVDNLVFVANNQLYSYDDQTSQSRLVFESDATSLSTVTSHGRQLVSLFATDGKTTSPSTYVFQISQSDYLPSKQGTRLVDVLSLYRYVESVDYSGAEVEIVLKLIPGKEPIVYYRPDGSGAVTYDKETVEKVQTEMTDKIKGLGIHTQDLKINYLF